ncbi:MAG: alpha-ketoglutarate-dependent dioxygenase AlkB [Actinobacteria bacterium]|nr:MAG: alpha-ketoglutarate-dependent dioxygenase AlkB [Actinomycetota bacterium]
MTLFGALEPSVAPMPSFERVVLDDTSWADVVREFLLGADSLFDTLVQQLPFTQSRRLMYDRWVDEPRLSCALDFGDAPGVVPALARVFDATYGVVFDSCFVNYYRDGHDSVTWHSDRIGRSLLDPMVAIVSLGGPRRFGLRPKGGGPSHGFTLYSGDALVMGGACQHRFEHRVPKMAYAAPRISLSFRHH